MEICNLKSAIVMRKCLQFFFVQQYISVVDIGCIIYTIRIAMCSTYVTTDIAKKSLLIQKYLEIKFTFFVFIWNRYVVKKRGLANSENGSETGLNCPISDDDMIQVLKKIFEIFLLQ